MSGGMALADYLVDALQRGRKFTSSATRWDGGDTVTVVVKDDDGRLWTLTITRGDG